MWITFDKMKPRFRLRGLARGSWSRIENGRGKERSECAVTYHRNRFI